MDDDVAVKSLAALGHGGRLHAFRLLMEAGPEGMAAGEIARRMDALQNTMSSNLSILANAGLITSRRDGRSVIYSVVHDHVGGLLEHMVQDCCAGSPDLYAPILQRLAAACSGRNGG